MVSKGFQVAHQKVSINIGLDGRIRGFTELTIIPTAADLKVVWLNARSMTILSTALRIPTAIPLAFSHLEPAPPSLTEPSNLHTYPELKRSIWRATNEGEEGELGIALPNGTVNKTQNLQEGKTPATPGQEAKKEDEWDPIVIAVEYEVTKAGIGLVVVKPEEGNSSRFPHVFTSASSDIGARTWVPCSDHLRDRCTWELELVAPRLLTSSSHAATVDRLNSEDDPDEDELDSDSEEWPITVVASGELVEQVVHPDRSDRVIWHFMQATPVSVHQVAWAVGPFVVTEIQGATKGAEKEGEEDEDLEEEEEVVKDEGPKLHALCLPGREEEMGHSVGVVRQAMDFYRTTFGSYPFSTYTVAFIDSLPSGSPTFHSAAMTLLSADLLHPPSIIDQAYETRHLLAHALAVQWSGVNLIPKHPSDNWLVVGIALHLTSLFVQRIWGNNEYRFRFKKDMIRCVAQDVQREPMSVPARHTQPEPDIMQFIALKAPLVLHILDKHLRKSGTTLGLDKVLPKLFLDAMTGELGSGQLANALSTTAFMRICRKACGVSHDSIKTFFDQWVYGSGCPTFVVTATFNRKKMAVELNVKQECLAYNWFHTASAEENGHLRPMSLFEGQMTIRIHEADGTPYEHVLNIQDNFKRHEVPFNTKYKRIRRNTKRYQARQAAATAAALGDQEAQEDMGLVDVGFSLSLWEEEKEREKWRVADWTEEDDVTMSQATYEWIRIDADLEWICGIQFEQPDFMWLSQLQRDRDVVAQLEAVHALSRLSSPIVSSNLTKTILVNNYFFRIRMEAALALIACATKQHDYLGLFHLFKLFQTRYCFEPDTDTQDPFSFRCIPKTNDFSDLTEYFLKKSLITAISMVRDEKGQTPPVVQQFLVDLLSYNDNLGNPFSDTFYITSIMNALGHAFVAVASREVGMFVQESYREEVEGNENLAPAIEEVERYISSDRLVPSYHNAITVAGIEFKAKMTLASLLPQDLLFLFRYTRDGNYPPVRIAAFDALLLLNPFESSHPPALTRYIFAVLREDSSRLVQRRLAQSILLSFPVLVATQDLFPPEKVFEEENSKTKGQDLQASVLKSLRKVPGRSKAYREALRLTLTYPDVDPEVLLLILKVCEVTMRPEGEPIPKMRFRVPSMVPESPAPLPLPSPALPKIKLGSSQSVSTPKVTIPLSNIENERPFDLAEPPAPAPPKKVKVKAPPKAAPSQASGMSIADVSSCKTILSKLVKDKSSVFFRAPVDPVKSGAPGYFEIIKNPMDLGTMQAKLLAGQYADRYAFREDFDLVISNAILYNGTGAVVETARKLESVFNKAWTRVEATLRAMDAKQAVVAPKAPKARPAVAETYEAPPAPAYDPYAEALAVATPSTKVSFKIKTSAAPTPTPPPQQPPSADPVKPAGFKITLGGSSLSQSPAPLAVESVPATPEKAAKPPKAPKQPKAPKMAKVASASSEVSSLGGLESSIKKPKKSKDKVVNYAEPEMLIPLPPARPEVLDLDPLPPPSKWVNPNDPIDPKKVKTLLIKMQGVREAYFFLTPVVAEGALASYYDEITEPMDLQTMMLKLEKGSYHTYGDVFDDFDRIVANCQKFNPPGTEPVWHVLILDRHWRAEWEKASKLSYNTKRSLIAFFKQIMGHGSAFPFLESVDKIIDQIPLYYTIVKPGTARDLGLIKRNLEADVYPTIEALEADVDLMLNNCFAFNAPDNQVHKSGLELQKMLASGINRIRSESGKSHKRTGDKAGGASKKQKVH